MAEESLLNTILGRYKSHNPHDIGACGFKLFIHSLFTFPLGFEITEFADDNDPFDVPNVQLGSYVPDLNGNLVVFNKPTPFVVTLNLPVDTAGEKNCRALYNSNFQAGGKASGTDIITMVVTYKDGTTKVALNGHIIGGSPYPSISMNGRYKTAQYQIVFNKSLN